MSGIQARLAKTYTRSHQRLNVFKCCQFKTRLEKYLVTSVVFGVKSLLKETLLTFITIPGSLSHIHLKTPKTEAKNVVKLNSI